MKVFVTGASGQLGRDMCLRLRAESHEVLEGTLPAFDLTQPEAVRATLREAKPDAVIHCAAYTAVDRAETEQTLCRRVNVEGTQAVAEACKAVNARMIYLSTDYVFDGSGDQPYEISSPTGPLNVYGQSKLEGERAVLETLERSFVVRTSWAFGLHGANYVASILGHARRLGKLSVVDDQVGSPTFTEDLAVLLAQMVRTDAYGVYHATNEGFCNRFDFTREILRRAGVPCELTPVSDAEYPSAAQRPLNSRLSKRSLDENGFARLPSWEDALARYLRRKGE